MNNNQRHTIDGTNTDKSILTIIFSIIEPGQHRTIEDAPRQLKTDAMLSDVAAVLGFVPFEFHDTNVTTKCSDKYLDYFAIQPETGVISAIR